MLDVHSKLQLIVHVIMYMYYANNLLA